LCEEPFESEAMDEDVTSVRAEIMQLAQQHFDAQRELVHSLLAEAALESVWRQLERDMERLERFRRKREEKENPERPPDETPPSDKT
jgi:hypothetical protein